MAGQMAGTACWSSEAHLCLYRWGVASSSRLQQFWRYCAVESADMTGRKQTRKEQSAMAIAGVSNWKTGLSACAWRTYASETTDNATRVTRDLLATLSLHLS